MDKKTLIQETQNDLQTPINTATILQLRRLIVLVPGGVFDEHTFVQQLREISLPAGGMVFFLAQATDPEQDHLAQQRLKRLTELMAGSGIQAGFKLVYADNWVQPVREVWQEGDELVCLEGHFVPGLLFAARPVAKVLSASLDLPIHILRGIHVSKRHQAVSELVNEALVYAISILTIGVFFIIQVTIDQHIGGQAARVLIVLSMLVEFWLIAKFTF